MQQENSMICCWHCGKVIDPDSLSPWFCGRICSQDYWQSAPHVPLSSQEERESAVLIKAATPSTRAYNLPLMGRAGY